MTDTPNWPIWEHYDEASETTTLLWRHPDGSVTIRQKLGANGPEGDIELSAEVASQLGGQLGGTPTTDPELGTATVRATRYTVNCLPEDDVNASGFEITVDYRGRGLWAVCRHRKCLAADGTWSWEARTSEREDEWIAAHRFDLPTAQRLAQEAARRVTVNGWTVDDALAMHAATTDAERDAVWDTIRTRVARAEAGDA